MNKVYGSGGGGRRRHSRRAVLMAGGFGLCGIPENLIPRASRSRHQGAHRHLETTAASTTSGSACSCSAARSARWSRRYVGENKTFERQYLSGELEVELCPRGRLAGGFRAGGAGIPAF